MTCTRRLSISLVLLALVAALACSHDNPPGAGSPGTGGTGEAGTGGAGGAGGSESGGAPDCGEGAATAAFCDLGEIEDARPLALLVLDGEILVGTTRGLFRRQLDSVSAWTASGLEGRAVQALHRSLADGDVLLAGLAEIPGVPFTSPIQRSTDGGRTWRPVGEALKDESLSTVEEPVYDSVSSFTSWLLPGGAEIFFANASAFSVVRSEDGIDWSYVSGKPNSFGFACQLHAPPDDGFVYQGCEVPQDVPWLRRFGVEEVPVPDSTFDAKVLDHESLGDGRPNLLASVPGALFVGVEGGLLRLDEGGPAWIHRAEGDADFVDVRALWIDPDDRDHLAFGGRSRGRDAPLALHRTFDRGATVRRVEAPAWLDGAGLPIDAGAALPGGGGIVLALTIAERPAPPRARVVLLRPAALAE